jgi:hypothetical protein
VKLKHLLRLRRRPITPGQIVTLRRPGGAGNTILAVDAPSFTALLEAFQSRRLARYTALREADRIRGVVNGTTAELLSVDGQARVVRILDGPLAGFTGWVEACYVHPVS